METQTSRGNYLYQESFKAFRFQLRLQKFQLNFPKACKLLKTIRFQVTIQLFNVYPCSILKVLLQAVGQHKTKYRIMWNIYLASISPPPHHIPQTPKGCDSKQCLSGEQKFKYTNLKFFTYVVNCYVIPTCHHRFPYQWIRLGLGTSKSRSDVALHRLACMQSENIVDNIIFSQIRRYDKLHRKCREPKTKDLKLSLTVTNFADKKLSTGVKTLTPCKSLTSHIRVHYVKLCFMVYQFFQSNNQHFSRQNST